MFCKENGQVSLQAIGIFVGAFLVLGGGILGLNYRQETKIENTASQANAQINSVKDVVDINSQRISKLEEAISTIKKDNSEIKADIKELLKILK